MNFEHPKTRVPRVEIDVNSILKDLVGNYSLTFMQDGIPVTFGELEVNKIDEKSSNVPLSQYDDFSWSTRGSSEIPVGSLTPPLQTSPGTQIQQISSGDDIDPLLFEPVFGLIDEDDFSSDVEFEFFSRFGTELYEWNLDTNFDVIKKIDNLRRSVSQISHKIIRKLAVPLANELTPNRRNKFPYSQSIRPPGQWPVSLPYKDPPHLLAVDRIFLVVWCMINPAHRLESFANATVDVPFQLRVDVWEAAMQIRQCYSQRL